MLDLRDLAVLELQAQRDLDRLAALLHHTEEADLLRHGIGHVDLERRRHGRRGFPEPLARLHRRDVLDEPRVRGDPHFGRVVRDERGEIGVDELVQAIRGRMPRWAAAPAYFCCAPADATDERGVQRSEHRDVASTSHDVLTPLAIESVEERSRQCRERRLRAFVRDREVAAHRVRADDVGIRRPGARFASAGSFDLRAVVVGVIREQHVGARARRERRASARPSPRTL